MAYPAPYATLTNSAISSAYVSRSHLSRMAVFLSSSGIAVRAGIINVGEELQIADL
jgi:hypothetical protein